MPKFRREGVIQDLDPTTHHYLITHHIEDDRIACVCASLPQPVRARTNTEPRNTNKGARNK